MEYTALDQLLLNTGTGNYILYAQKTELSQQQYNMPCDIKYLKNIQIQ